MYHRQNFFMLLTKHYKNQIKPLDSSENKKFYTTMKNLLPMIVSEWFQVKGDK